jgi:hypothetical protein
MSSMARSLKRANAAVNSVHVVLKHGPSRAYDDRWLCPLAPEAPNLSGMERVAGPHHAGPDGRLGPRARCCDAAAYSGRARLWHPTGYTADADGLTTPTCLINTVGNGMSR